MYSSIAMMYNSITDLPAQVVVH